jgi:hypothetical protein
MYCGCVYNVCAWGCLHVYVCFLNAQLLVFKDPLCLHGGEYETDQETCESSSPDTTVDVQRMLRLKVLCRLIVWGSLSVAALANLAYASYVSSASGLSLDAATLAPVILPVAVSVGGVVFISAVVCIGRICLRRRLARRLAAVRSAGDADRPTVVAQTLVPPASDGTKVKPAGGRSGPVSPSSVVVDGIDVSSLVGEPAGK